MTVDKILDSLRLKEIELKAEKKDLEALFVKNKGKQNSKGKSNQNKSQSSQSKGQSSQQRDMRNGDKSHQGSRDNNKGNNKCHYCHKEGHFK